MARKGDLTAIVSSNPRQEDQNVLLTRYKEIFELEKQGLNAEQIARKLKKDYGEVSFILQFGPKS